MGLDMYLTAERFLYNFGDANEDTEALQLLDKIPLIGKGDMKPCSIRYNAMYWRKSYLIHRWFVKNCQQGIDDCRYAEVGIEQLYDLVELCDKIVNDHPQASSLISTLIERSYDYEILADTYEQFAETSKQLTKIIKTPGIECWDFIYHSSW